MKKLALVALLGVGVPSIILILFLLFAPEDRVNAATEKWKRLNNDPAQVCFDLIRKELKDPDSARIISYERKPFGKEGKEELHIVYKAKNSYGAYVKGEDFCVIGPSIVADKSNMSANMSAETNIRKIQLEIDATKKRIEKYDKH